MPIPVTPLRLLFLLSQLLYQSTEYYHHSPSTLTHLPQLHPITLLTLTPAYLRTAIYLLLIVCVIVGWYRLLGLRQLGWELELVEMVGVPLGVGLLGIEYGGVEVLPRVLMFMVIAVSACLKIVAVMAFHPEYEHNEFLCFSPYNSLFRIVRLVALLTLSLLTSPQVLIYFLLALQLLSTGYKALNLVHYTPQAQWTSMVTELWGWLSIAKFILHQSGLHYQSINLMILVLGYVCFKPSDRLISVLEYKVRSMLDRYKAANSRLYEVVVVVYYVGVVEGVMRGVWSRRFRYEIKAVVEGMEHGQQHGIYNEDVSLEPKSHGYIEGGKQGHQQGHQQGQQQGQHLGQQAQDLHPTRSLIFLTPTQHHTLNDSSPLHFLQSFLLSNNLLPQLQSSHFQPAMHLCFLLAHTPTASPTNLYQFYYQLLLACGNKSIIKCICMEILFRLIGDRDLSRRYTGRYVVEIMRYEGFNAELRRFVGNERKLLKVLSQSVLDLGAYREYLDQKMEIKDKIRDILVELEFKYPYDSTLPMKDYIVERYINKNEVASKQMYLYMLEKCSKKKTRVLSFHDCDKDDKAIFLCDLLRNKGLILYSNKNFENALLTRSEGNLKLRDLLPDFWSDMHEEKLQHLHTFQQNYQHNPQQSYYLKRLNGQYLQATLLHVLPYFQLNNQALFLVQMYITNAAKEVIIEPVLMEAGDASHVDSRLHESQQQGETRRKIAFKHEVFEDEKMNTIEETIKEVEVFDQRYQVKVLTKCQNIYTNNMIEQSVEMEENIEAIIKYGLDRRSKLIETLQRMKNRVNLFSQLKNWLAWRLLLLSLVYITVVIVIGQSFIYYNNLFQQDTKFQLKYRQVFVGVVTYQSVLLTISRNMRFTNNPKVQSLYTSDAVYLSESMIEYIGIINKLAKYRQFHPALFSTYSAILRADINTLAPFNIIQPSYIYLAFLESANLLIAGNQTDNWLYVDFSSMLAAAKQVHNNQKYINNQVLQAMKQTVSALEGQYVIVYCVCQVLAVLSPLLVYVVLWRGKVKIETVLLKPLYMEDAEVMTVKNDCLELSEYINKEKHNNVEKINKGTTGFIMLNQSRSVMPTLQMMSTVDSFYKEDKKTTGHFMNIYGLVVLSLAAFGFVLGVSFTKLYYRVLDTQRQLTAFAQYANLNNQVFIMYNSLLELVLDKQLSQQDKRATLNKILQVKDKISKLDVPTTITNMLFDPSLTQQVLYGDPCSWSKMCPLIGRKINPYPVELNLFMSHFYSLYSHIASTTTLDPNNPPLKLLIYEAFCSVRSLSQLNHWIFDKSYQSIDSKFTGFELWTVLCYLGMAVFVIVILLQALRMVLAGRAYGREILGILGSGEAVKSPSMEFEINSILYRTNFAKDVPVV